MVYVKLRDVFMMNRNNVLEEDREEEQRSIRKQYIYRYISITVFLFLSSPTPTTFVHSKFLLSSSQQLPVALTCRIVVISMHSSYGQKCEDLVMF